MFRRLALPLEADLADAAAQREVRDVGELARCVARGHQLGGARGCGGLLLAADLQGGGRGIAQGQPGGRGAREAAFFAMRACCV